MSTTFNSYLTSPIPVASIESAFVRFTSYTFVKTKYSLKQAGIHTFVSMGGYEIATSKQFQYYF